jgi:cell division protein FtsN
MATRKYNTRKQKKYPRKAAAKNKTPIAWLASGILIGLLIPSIIYLKSPIKTQVETKTTPPISEKVHAKIQSKVLKSKEKPEKKNASNKSHYDFYDLLSTEENNSDNSNAPAKEPTENLPSKFSLEIATVRNYVAADQLKAQLLLMGIDDVAITKNNSKPAQYRVSIGPFSSRTQANKVQQSLKQNAIDSTLVVE